MSEQLAFELPHRPALGADDFLVSGCNAMAVALIDAWPDWPSPINAITGPPGGGKTHLAHVWSLRSGAATIRPDKHGCYDLESLTTEPGLILEDLDRGGYDEASLFHLLNSARERGMFLLLTGARAPARWPVALPDLASRLRSIPLVAIGEPDDGLLRAVLLKQFADRQLDVEPALIAYLADRMERSMAAARQIVSEIDLKALGTGRRITRPLAAGVLAELQNRRPSDL